MSPPDDEQIRQVFMGCTSVPQHTIAPPTLARMLLRAEEYQHNYTEWVFKGIGALEEEAEKKADCNPNPNPKRLRLHKDKAR